MNGIKSQPLTKEEVMQLINLVEANSVVTSKVTNASNNQLKEAAWLKITSHFNSAITGCPRKPDQLKLKWENLKKAARKRSTRIRMNNLKTGGGKPDYIPPDEALDKVAGMLGATCEGYTVPFGGDAEEVVELNSFNEVTLVPFSDSGDGMLMESSGDGGAGVHRDPVPLPVFSPKLDHMETPKNKKFFFTSNKSTGKQKMQKLTNEDIQARINRNNAVADYYISKRNMIDNLNEKIKLEIEMLKIQKKQRYLKYKLFISMPVFFIYTTQFIIIKCEVCLINNK